MNEAVKVNISLCYTGLSTDRAVVFCNAAAKLALGLKFLAKALYNSESNFAFSSRAALKYGELFAANTFLAAGEWLPQVEPRLRSNSFNQRLCVAHNAAR